MDKDTEKVCCEDYFSRKFCVSTFHKLLYYHKEGWLLCVLNVYNKVAGCFVFCICTKEIRFLFS